MLNDFISYFWLCWVFVAVCVLSLVKTSSGCSLVMMLAWASHCSNFSCCRAKALGHVGSVVATHRLSCPIACGIFLDQGLKPCTLRCKADSQPLGHQGNLNDGCIKNDESLFLLNLYFDGDWGGVRQKPNIYLYMRKLMQNINKQGR